MASNQKEFISEGLFGGMDTRSESGAGEPGSWRVLFNVDGRERRTLCRMGGWMPYGYEKFLPPTECFNNRDLHDQMIGAQVYQEASTYTVPPYSVVTGYDHDAIYYINGPPKAAGQAIDGKYCDDWTLSPFPVGFANGVYVASTWAGYPKVYEQAYDAGDKVTWELEIAANRDAFVTPEPGETLEAFYLQFTVDWTSPSWGSGQTKSELLEAPYEWAYELPGGGTGYKQPWNNPVQIRKVRICLPGDIDVTKVTILTGANGRQWGRGIRVDGKGLKAVTPVDVCEGAPTDFNCDTGAPDFWRLPSYSLGYGYNVPGYIAGPYHGAEVPIYQTFQGYSYTLTGEGYFYYPGVLTCKEAISLLHPITSTDGKRRLIAGSRSRVYVNDDSSGNWTIIADGLGGPCNRPDDCTCSHVRFTAASLGNSTILANGVDPVLVYEFSAASGGSYGWSADYLMEAVSLGISAAFVVVSFQGFLFMANMKVDGIWQRARIQWCDYNDPLSWAPGGESLAGFQDFGRGEKILNAVPIGGRLRVYTDQAIYDGQLVNDARVFQFTEIYRGRLVPVARHSVVSTGDSHFFLGAEGIYRIAEYDREPVQLEWIRQASGVIFNGLKAEWMRDSPFGPFDGWDMTSCDLITAGWSQKYRCLWFTWPTAGSECPNMTLVLWTDFQKSTLVDHGFTAFTEWMPDDSITWRNFLAETGACPPLESLEPKEGVPCPINYQPGPPGAPPPGTEWPYLWNANENYDEPMEPDSYFAQFCNVCIDDMCNQCESDGRFLMVSAEDKCLKEWTPNRFARIMLASETAVEFPETSVATYEEVGYTTMLQTLETMSGTEALKTMRAVALSYQAAYQIEPGFMYGQAGASESSYCLDWETVPPEMMDCTDNPEERSASQMRFPFYSTGIHHALRFWSTGTGSQFCLSALSVKMTAIQKCW